MLDERRIGGGEFVCDCGQFFLRRAMPLFRLRDFFERFQVLRFDFVNALLIKMHPAFVPADFRLQFQSALLLRCHLVFEGGQQCAQARNFTFQAQHVAGAGFDFVAQIFDGRIFLTDFQLQHVVLMPH